VNDLSPERFAASDAAGDGSTRGNSPHLAGEVSLNQSPDDSGTIQTVAPVVRDPLAEVPVNSLLGLALMTPMWVAGPMEGNNKRRDEHLHGEGKIRRRTVVVEQSPTHTSRPIEISSYTREVFVEHASNV
jgi:hypothetical protein